MRSSCDIYTQEMNFWVIGNTPKQFSKVVVLIYIPNYNRWEFSYSIFIQDLSKSVFFTLDICWVFMYLIAMIIYISFMITVVETVQNLCECVRILRMVLNILSHFAWLYKYLLLWSSRLLPTLCGMSAFFIWFKGVGRYEHFVKHIL